MKKNGIGSRIISMLLVLVMVLSVLPVSSFAALYDLKNVDTGLVNNKIDITDTISLPVEILDYNNDGMLFEYAEANAIATGRAVGSAKTAKDFGATWSADFASLTAIGNVTSSMFGNFWDNVTRSLNTGNSYASRMRVSWNENTASNGGAFYGRASVITPNDLGGMAMNNVRYLVMVYRSNVTSGKIGFWVERENLTTRTDNKNRTGDLNFTSEGGTNWTYAVYDLKQGNLDSTWSSYGKAKSIFTTLPIDASGEWMDIAHIALFSNEAQAEAFGQYALTDGSDRGDNRAFGLLRGSRAQSDAQNNNGSLFAGIDRYNDTTKAAVEQLGWFSKENATSISGNTTTANIGYQLLGDNYYGISTAGLLESKLSDAGYPVYKKEVVGYLAELLQKTLPINERTSDGWKEYRYLQGAPSPVYGGVDFASALRNCIPHANNQYPLGTYNDAAAKKLVGTWAECSGNIKTCYDAAYFMLNSIFVSGSYNEPQVEGKATNYFNYLVLSAGHDKETVDANNPEGDKVYVFDAGFTTDKAATAVSYDITNHTIQNTKDAAAKTEFVYELNSEGEDGGTTTIYPFLPVYDDNNKDGMTNTVYYQDDGVINRVKEQESMDTLYKRDFNFALKSEGEFVYYADDELFFEFEGDDDVYLFINDELVMDLGAAHGLDGYRFELNDYVNAAKAGTLGSAARNQALSLVDGNTYSFKFYYMERHSYGSNMRIMTNIRVTDPKMETEKVAWQDDVQLDFGSIVDKDKYVEYGFAITNNGDENLYNLTFEDQAIGVKLDSVNGIMVDDTAKTKDKNGGALGYDDLSAVITHPNYDPINVTFTGKADFTQFLKDLTAPGTEAGAGLFVGATVQIRGFGYMLTDAQVKAGVFDNTVLTTATNKTESKTLHGQASMRVFVPADPMYYEWAGKDLKVSKTKLVEDILAAANQAGNVLAGKVPNLTTSNVKKIELVTKSGTVITSENVKIDSNNDLTINYPTPGSKVFYVKITYNTSQTVTVPVLVNVTDVKDSVFVLDYGLKVNLNEGTELFKNDALTVPGRPTKSDIIAIGSNGAYSPNEITFTKSDDVTGSYGNFNFSNSIFSYTPNKFMEGVDEVQVALNVYENGITPSMINGDLNINKEVEMYKSVSVLPANVVYYEDDFPAIKYKKDNTSASNDTFVKLGTTQSNNQDEEYGHDDRYENATSDENSGNSLTTITINDNTTAAYFFFKGTGLELISRTNATDSGKLALRIYNASDVDADGNIINKAKPIKDIPVITEFDHNDDGGNEAIYQVPVIRVNDLPLDENGQAKQYAVLISGIPTRDYTQTGTDGMPLVIPTNLYIDGLRIYQPGEGNADIENKYDADEKDAQFIELRKQIVEGKVAVGSYTEDSGLELNTALHTWTEDHDGKLTSNEVDTVEDYLLRGPNNEVYVTGTYDNAALIFYVKDTNANAVSSLQIALRAIDENLFFSGNETGAKATVLYGTGTGWAEVVTDMTSSTEQYFTIDLSKCPVTDMGYQVVVQVKEGMVSFSSLKLTGLELHTIGEAFGEIAFINGIWYKNFEADVDPAQLEPLSDDEFVNISGIKEQLAAPYVPEEEVPETEPTEPEAPKPVKPTKPVTPFDPSDIFGGDYFSRHQQIKKMLQWINSWMGR